MNKQQFNNAFRKFKPEQSRYELYQLLRFVNQIKPQNILEVGIRGGGTLSIWREAWPEAFIVGVDIAPKERIKYAADEIIVGDSTKEKTQEAAGEFAPYDFLFIDGDHTYKVAKSDFEMYAPLVRPGGIIAFHDSKMQDGESVAVHLFMAELKGRLSLDSAEFWAGPGAPGTTAFIK